MQIKENDISYALSLFKPTDFGYGTYKKQETISDKVFSTELDKELKSSINTPSSTELIPDFCSCTSKPSIIKTATESNLNTTEAHALYQKLINKSSVCKNNKRGMARKLKYKVDGGVTRVGQRSGGRPGSYVFHCLFMY